MSRERLSYTVYELCFRSPNGDYTTPLRVFCPRTLRLAQSAVYYRMFGLHSRKSAFLRLVSIVDRGTSYPLLRWASEGRPIPGRLPLTFSLFDSVKGHRIVGEDWRSFMDKSA